MTIQYVSANIKYSIEDLATSHLPGFVKDLKLMYSFIDQSNRGDAWALLHNDDVIGILGIVKLWNGVGEVWAYYGPNGIPKEHTKFIWRATKNLFITQCNSRKYHRIQSTCVSGEKYIRFLEHLGLGFEARLQKYYHNQKDGLLYSVIFNIDGGANG